MPLYLDGPVIRQNQALEDFSTPFRSYIKSKVDDALDNNITPLLIESSRLGDQQTFDEQGLPLEAAPPRVRLDAATATEKVKAANVRLDISPDGIPADALDVLIARKRRQKAYDDAVNRSPTGLRSVAGFGASFIGSALDPLNLASAFVPVVGEARYTLLLARATGALGRAGLRAGVGALEGLAGAAMLEPLTYVAHQSLQDDYKALDSIVNIGFGGVLGGGLHVMGGAVRDVLQPGRWANAKEMHEAITTARTEAQATTKAAELAPDDVGARLRSVEAKAEQQVIEHQVSAARLPHDLAPKPLELAEMQRGVEAAQRVITEKVDVPAAVMSVEHGPVTLVYGEPGRGSNFRGGFGLAHIIAKHGGEEVIAPVIETIVRGAVRKTQDSPAGDPRVVLNYKGHEALLSLRRYGAEETWLLSGWKEGPKEGRPGDRNKGDDSSRTTAPGPTLTRAEDGAGRSETIPRQPSAADRVRDASPPQRETAMRVAVAQALDGKVADVTPIFDPTVNPADTVRNLKDRLSDPEGSRQADERLKAAPKSMDLKAAEAELARTMAELETRWEQTGRDPAELKALMPGLDDMTKQADELARAARAAALCDVGGA